MKRSKIKRKSQKLNESTRLNTMSSRTSNLKSNAFNPCWNDAGKSSRKTSNNGSKSWSSKNKWRQEATRMEEVIPNHQPTVAFPYSNQLQHNRRASGRRMATVLSYPRICRNSKGWHNRNPIISVPPTQKYRRAWKISIKQEMRSITRHSEIENDCEWNQSLEGCGS